jgi:pectinesterase
MIKRRAVIGGALATALASRGGFAATRYDAVVGAGGHASIGDAVQGAAGDGTRPYRILVRAGTWREKLTLDKPGIHLVGENRERCIILYDAASGQLAPDGERWGTRRSATLTIAASDCGLHNLTVVNSFDYDAASATPPVSASLGYQAVALAIVGAADRTCLDEVVLDGHQDTFLSDAGRTSVRDCVIRGHVDFIFGAGTTWLQRCEIQARARAQAGERWGYLTAPSTLLSSRYGLVFDHCRLTKQSGVPAGSFALGRPWRPTTVLADGRYGNPQAVGQSIFKNCWMDDHIAPAGWDRMSYATKDGGRASLEPAEARFGEYRSRGAGARASVSRPQLSRQQALQFNRDQVLDGWRPISIL